MNHSHLRFSLGRTGFEVTRFGFGTYRVDRDVPSHRRSLMQALVSGINLVDTSTNYTDGESESLIGDVLSELVRESKVEREKIFIVSKVGYVQGQNLEDAQDREAKGSPYPEMVKVSDGCWHCIHPEFIEKQLEQSLMRLQLNTLDAYLLHNPEYLLQHLHSQGTSVELARGEFYKRIEKAFQYLEGEVSKGRIRWYGVSSNTFGAPDLDPEMTSLSRLLEIAESVGGKNHHFALAQMPMNWFETGPALEPNQKKEASALRFARENKMGVLINRPLNAFAEGHLFRLCDFSTVQDLPPLDQSLRNLSLLEKEFQETLQAELFPQGKSQGKETLFFWSHELQSPRLLQLPVEQWLDLIQYRITPHVHALISYLDSQVSSEKRSQWDGWRQDYLQSLFQTLEVIRSECAESGSQARATLHSKINPLIPTAWKSETLSFKALATLASVPEIGCVLVGMRHPKYVDEVLHISQSVQELWPTEKALTFFAALH